MDCPKCGQSLGLLSADQAKVGAVFTHRKGWCDAVLVITEVGAVSFNVRVLTEEEKLAWIAGGSEREVPVTDERIGKFAGQMSDNLKTLGRSGWGITMAILIEMAKHHGFTRERLLSSVGRAWDTWID